MFISVITCGSDFVRGSDFDCLWYFCVCSLVLACGLLNFLGCFDLDFCLRGGFGPCVGLSNGVGVLHVGGGILLVIFGGLFWICCVVVAAGLFVCI